MQRNMSVSAQTGFSDTGGTESSEYWSGKESLRPATSPVQQVGGCPSLSDIEDKA